MLRVVCLISLSLLFACSETPGPRAVAIDINPKSSAVPLGIEVYLVEANEENNCLRLLNSANPRPNLAPSLVYESLAEFQTKGFAAIEIKHVPASKKLLIFIIAIESTSGKIVSNACVENVEVDKGSVRDIHLVLNSNWVAGERE